MEINEFDKIVKEQMSKMEVVPSTGIKKALAFKMFFNNLLLFHKVKLVAALFLVSSGVYIGINYTGDENASVSEGSITEINESDKTDNNLNKTKNLAIQSANEEEHIHVGDQQEKENDQLSFTNNTASVDVQNSTNSDSFSVNSEADGLSSFAGNLDKSNSTVEKVSVSTSIPDNSSSKVKNPTDNSNNTNDSNDGVVSNEQVVDKGVKSIVKDIEKNYTLEAKMQEEKGMVKFDIIDPVIIETEIALNITLPAPVAVKPMDDYVNNPKKRGFTIDGYYSAFNKVDIDNELNADLAEYHWDFYKEHDYVKTSSRGGVNINYNWNNFKIGSGLQLSTLKDYKSVYRYMYLPGSSNGNFVIPTISGAVVYGEDTTIVFHVDPLNEDLKKEVENEYNTYTYLKVPLTLGYELDLKYVSLELNAGVEYGHLINANGVEVKERSIVNEPVQVYFYDDKVMGMMSRKSENLNKHQFAILANATLRVRLNPSFDLYSSVNYTQSRTSIYSDSYFLQKSYKNYGAKIGVTYYLNKRLKLKETTTSSFD